MLSLLIFLASFGILINGTDYHAGTQNPTPVDPSFQEYMCLGLSLNSGDQCQLYDRDNQAAWAVPLDNASVTAIRLDGDHYTCSTAGCYDFYIKLKFENDQLYIGPGTCGSEGGGNSGEGGGNTGEGGGNTGGNDNPTPQTYTSAPAQCADVMLQAFYWDSYQDKGYGRTKWIDLKTQAAEIGSWFDLVWLPPSSKSTGGTGYLPIQYSSLDGDWGTKANLLAVIDTLHRNGCRVVADAVVNHAAGSNGWCTMAKNNFGTYGVFEPTMNWICSDDEAFTGGHCTETPGNPDDGYGSEKNYEAGRDWDHNNADVRAMFRAYAKWLRYTIGYDGFRYDYCKGFHNSHINEYNTASQAYFSVMEMWDGNVNTLQSHLNDAGWNTLTFDFATKYQALNNGIAADNYAGCRGAGLLGAGKGRYAVTFVDSHDSFQRDNNEFCGAGNSMRYPEKLLQANAYILAMPGVPCVFYPHWVSFKDEIKAMINARYLTGVHSESAVSDEAGNGYYRATITGKNGTIRLLLGPNSGHNSTPDGYTLAVKGNNYGVYYRLNSARADKNTSRTPIPAKVDPEKTEDIMSIPAKTEKTAQKCLINGKLYIRINDQIYDITGHIR